MNRMKYSFTLIIILIASISLNAQIDSSEGSAMSIPAVEEEKETPSTPENQITNNGLSTPNPDKVNGLTVPKQKALERPKKEFSMFGEEFGNPGELYEKQVKKHLKYTEENKEAQNNGSTVNQYLGDVKTKVDRVNIIYRDHQYPDGDLIRVFVNDDVAQPSVLLRSTFRGFKLNLVKGFNKIDFLALNQGESGPNTAEFQILDDDGNVISTNVWNLATGVKATIIVIKE